MKALDVLHNRSSYPKLVGPEPEQEVLDNIFKAAIRAADHALLRPWRFLIIKGDARHKLAELFIAAATADRGALRDEEIRKLRHKPLRAPVIIVTVSSPKPHPKVPEFEQDLSAAAATQNMLNAAYAQGLGSMWRTGSMAFHPVVKEGLGLSPQEKIIGFLYLGSSNGGSKNLPEEDFNQYCEVWE